MSAGDRISDHHQRSPESESPSGAWGVLLFGFFGATATTFAAIRLRRTVGWIYTQLRNAQSTSSWQNATNNSTHGGFREEAWKRYQKRMQEEHEDEIQRVERIRRMQSVFNRDKNKFRKSYESWRENAQEAYQHIPREDWYYKTESSYSYWEQRSNSKPNPQRSVNSSMSHHYSVLGLDRSRAKPYSDDEVKKAFRGKAMEYHPDQNLDNKELAEAKFKEVMASYEAIKQERKNEGS